MKIKVRFNQFFAILSLVLFFACVKNRDFDQPLPFCDQTLTANITYAEVKNLYVDQTLQIQEDLIIEGYIISSDSEGNFFSVLHFQDSPINPTQGFQMEIDVRDSHLFYPVGSKIFIKLRGLYLGSSKDVFKVGGVFTSFGNQSVGRLPAAVVNQHIIVSCNEAAEIKPNTISINDLDNSLTNTLVQFSNVEILEEQLGQLFAIEREETERTLTDCSDNEIVLLNSGFSDFQADKLPEGNGTITGVLLREKDNFQVAIRTLDDIVFNQERCEELVDEFTSQNIFISELADPENNTGARFVELYNSADEPLSLKGWRLHRYTNGSTEISSTIDLSDFTIGSEETLVISPNAQEFETVYGFPPDMEVGLNSPADSNGDDNLELVDPFGEIVDIFGVVGEDGSGTNHEFEDGRAVRNVKIKEANHIYTFDEWRIFNDTGDEGTTKEIKKAPEDFTPSIRN